MVDIVTNVKKTYYEAVYGVTKVLLEPVVAAVSDVLRESVSESLKDGIHDALISTDFVGDLIFGRRRKKK
jgi:hypothetical protein